MRALVWNGTEILSNQYKIKDCRRLSEFWVFPIISHAPPPQIISYITFNPITEQTYYNRSDYNNFLEGGYNLLSIDCENFFAEISSVN